MQRSYFHSEDTDRDLIIDELRNAFDAVQRQDGALDEFLDDCRAHAIDASADIHGTSPLFVLTDAEVRAEYDAWIVEIPGDLPSHADGRAE